jgi:hypothetical protein
VDEVSPWGQATEWVPASQTTPERASRMARTLVTAGPARRRQHPPGRTPAGRRPGRPAPPGLPAGPGTPRGNSSCAGGLAPGGFEGAAFRCSDTALRHIDAVMLRSSASMQCDCTALLVPAALLVRSRLQQRRGPPRARARSAGWMRGAGQPLVWSARRARRPRAAPLLVAVPGRLRPPTLPARPSRPRCLGCDSRG